jgi:NAD(P)-dependent dehydrogenase (short-subunit alcohol dehydrogenase family)
MAQQAATMDCSLETLFGCAGKAFVVTGGTKGVGLLIAYGLVQNGARVHVFSRKPDEQTAAKLTAMGPGKVISYQCNVDQDEDVLRVRDLVAAVEPAGIHCLINNSGKGWGDSFDKTPRKSFDQVLGVNVTGLFMVSQAFMPLLERSASAANPGRVINIASVDAFRVPDIEEYAYTASKAAVIHLTHQMAGHLASRHISVNCISPGLFPSKMLDKIFSEMPGEKTMRHISFKRLGSAQDITGAVLYLAGAAGAYVTGANILVEGGILVNKSNL